MKRDRSYASRFLSSFACLAIAGACAIEGDDIGTSELIVYGTATRQGQGVPNLQIHIFRGPPTCPALDANTAFTETVTDAFGKYRRRIVTLFTDNTMVCWRAVVLFTHPDNSLDSVVQGNILFATQNAQTPQDSLRIDFSIP